MLKDTLGWGFILWFIGFGLSMILFPLVPVAYIGWIITPIATAATLWVLFKKIKGKSLKYYAVVGVAWLLIAVVFDYFFIVKAFRPADGYYKTDVYLYYLLILALPVIVGWRKTMKTNNGIPG